jgi:hypothetical protein
MMPQGACKEDYASYVREIMPLCFCEVNWTVAVIRIIWQFILVIWRWISLDLGQVYGVNRITERTNAQQAQARRPQA